jgi:hypothetical protein
MRAFRREARPTARAARRGRAAARTPSRAVAPRGGPVTAAAPALRGAPRGRGHAGAAFASAEARRYSPGCRPLHLLNAR